MNDFHSHSFDNELTISVEAAMLPAAIELYLEYEETKRKISSLLEGMRILNIHMNRTARALRELAEIFAKEA